MSRIASSADMPRNDAPLPPPNRVEQRMEAASALADPVLPHHLGMPPIPAVVGSVPATVAHAAHGAALTMHALAEALLATAAPAEAVDQATVAQYRAALAQLPPPFAVLHRRDRRAFYRHAVEVVDGRHPAPASVADARSAWYASCAATLHRATATAWAELAAARAAARGTDGWVQAGLGPPVETPKGCILGGTFGSAHGDWQRLSTFLSGGYQWSQVRGRSLYPWMHWVGTYKSTVSPSQMCYDAQAVMTGVGMPPRAHPWALFGHGSHWHLVLSRVRWDGRRAQSLHLAVAQRLTVDALDAEAGSSSPFLPPVGDAMGFRQLARGALMTAWVGMPGHPEEITEVPLQGPAWAHRLAELGRYPDRVPGLMVLPKPSYVTCAGIVRHCIDGD